MNWKFWKKKSEPSLESPNAAFIVQLIDGNISVTACWPTPHNHNHAHQMAHELAAMIELLSEGHLKSALIGSVAANAHRVNQREIGNITIGLMTTKTEGDGLVVTPTEAFMPEPRND